jgi:ankyrin repeat protein
MNHPKLPMTPQRSNWSTSLRPSSRAGHWSLLHWACGAGEPDVVERLLEEGLSSQSVTISQFPGEWTPLSIALFHGNKDMLEKLSLPSKSILCTGDWASQLPGERHGDYYCKGCLHVSEYLTSLRKHLTIDGYIWAALPLSDVCRV